MELTKAEDNAKEYHHERYVNLEHNIEIGIHPVIFGWRVRGGFINNGWYEIDYCCGNKQENVEMIFSMCVDILKKHGNFKAFPRQDIKPVFNDSVCFLKLIELSNGFETIKLRDIHELRIVSLSDLFSTL